MYLKAPPFDIDAEALSLRLYVPILKSLFCEKVSTPLIVMLARSDTGAAAAFVLLSSTLPKTPFPSMVCVKVPFRTILPAPVCSPELKIFFATLIEFPLSLRVPLTSLKLSETFMVDCVPAKSNTTPTGLLIVRFVRESGAARFTVNV